MLKHYLVTGLRMARRHPGSSAINVAGLSVGLACVILIVSYVWFERSYDRFHADADRLYRVEKQEPGNVYLGSDRFALTPAPLGETLRERVAQVEDATTFYTAEYLVGRPGREPRSVEEGLWADEHFFRLFTFPLVRGDSATALASPGTVVLTASLAQKLFGTADPMGQTVQFGESDTYTVTGIAADPPATSHVAFSYVLSIHSGTFYLENRDGWSNSSWYTYARLAPGADPAALDRRLTDLYVQRQGEGGSGRLYLKPIASIHLADAVNFDLGEPGDARMVTLFSAIAVVILLLACANYTNLAVARSTQRARDVGLRKAIGAGRGQLVVQHLSESLLTAFASLLIGVGIAWLAMPTFGAWLGRDLTLGAFGAGPLAMGLLGLGALVGLIAGGYPAFVLASVQPTKALKGDGLTPGGNARLRSLLVVAQYAAAVVLVVGSFVVYQQMQFVREQTVGFEGEQVVTLYSHDLLQRGTVPAFTDALDLIPGVEGASASYFLPFDIGSSTSLDAWEGHTAADGEEVPIYMVDVDEDYFGVYGLDMAAGRAFSSAFPADTNSSLILNETAVRRLGWTPATAIGKTVDFRGEAQPVVGVVRDFHLHSLHQPIEPLLMRYSTRWSPRVSIRVASAGLPQTMAAIRSTWEQFSDYPFEPQFISEDFATLYRADQRLGEGMGYFTVLALFIACLGLFGLAAFTAEQRTKEIGVRKVIGASVAGIVALVSKDFVRLVLVAIGVAVPVAYYASSRWLEGFAYHVGLGAGVFLLAGALALVVALLAVSTHALRAASADPIKALRSE